MSNNFSITNIIKIMFIEGKEKVVRHLKFSNFVMDGIVTDGKNLQ